MPGRSSRSRTTRPAMPGWTEACSTALMPGGTTARSAEFSCASVELAPHDRETLVVDRGGETAAVPERGAAGTRLVLAARQVRIGLDRGEPALAQVVAHGLHEASGVTFAARVGGRRDAGD